MDNADQLQRLIDQERRLVLPRFDLKVAWQIGSQLHALAMERGQPLAIEVRVSGQTVFFCAMEGVAPINADWVRRKRNTVELMHRSSLSVGLEWELDGKAWANILALPDRDYGRHGGGFPLQVAGAGCIGAITVSGAPHRDDHSMVVQVLAGLCGIPADEVATDPPKRKRR